MRLSAIVGAARTSSTARSRQGPAAVALAGVLGVALARWLPYLPVAPVAAVGVLVFQMPFAMWNLQGGYVWFAPLVNSARTGPDSSWPCSLEQTWPCVLERFAIDSVGWHLLYLASFATLLAAQALLRDGRRPRYLVACGAGLVLAVLAGILQIP